MGGGDMQRKTFGLRLDEEIRARLAALAKKLGIRTPELARNLLAKSIVAEERKVERLGTER